MMAAKKKAKGTTAQPSRKVKKSAFQPGRAIRPPTVAKSKGKSLQPASETAEQPAALLPPGYAKLLEDIKGRIQQAQVRAAVGVSRELIRLYWDIGREIVQRQEREGWGKAVVQRLAADVQREFPGMAGFSPQNIWYMRAFYLAWTGDVAKLQQPVGELDGRNLPHVVGEIPWGHNLQLLTKLKDPRQRLWYAQKVVQHGWSRATLVHQIELGLYGREGRAITNFPATLPVPQSDLAQQTLKDPYVFDDRLSIGIILCKSRDKVTAEYALRDTRKPIGVSQYRLTEALPQELQPSLPTIEQLEEELKQTKTDDRA